MTSDQREWINAQHEHVTNGFCAALLFVFERGESVGGMSEVARRWAALICRAMLEEQAESSREAWMRLGADGEALGQMLLMSMGSYGGTTFRDMRSHGGECWARLQQWAEARDPGDIGVLNHHYQEERDD